MLMMPHVTGGREGGGESELSWIIILSISAASDYATTTRKLYVLLGVRKHTYMGLGNV